MFKHFVIGLVALFLFACVVQGATTTTSATATAATATSGSPNTVVTQNITITANVTYTPFNDSVVIDNEEIADRVADLANVSYNDVNVTSTAFNSSDPDANPGRITVIIYFRNGTEIAERADSKDPHTQVNYFIALTSTLINSQASNWSIFINSTSVNGTYVADVVPTTTTSGGHSLTSGATTHIATGTVTSGSTTNHTSAATPMSSRPSSFRIGFTGIVGLLCSSLFFW